MKVYVAGKWQDKSDPDSDLSRIMRLIDGMGIELTLDWSELGDPRSEEAAEVMRYAVMEADALILVWHENLLGGLLETGMAMGAGKPVML